MKRRIFKLCVFLLLGAIVNVAVAFGCVVQGVRGNEVTRELFRLAIAHLVLHSGPTDHWSPPPRRLPTTQTDIRHIRRPGVDVVMGWPRMCSNGSMQDDVSVDIIAGWPTQCICGAIPQEAPILKTVNDRFGSRVDSALRLRTISSINGFAINTIFYAAILWLLFAFPFALRRRRRIKRGLCPACAYPVGDNAVCTECGKAVRRTGRAIGDEPNVAILEREPKG